MKKRKAKLSPRRKVSKKKVARRRSSTIQKRKISRLNVAATLSRLYFRTCNHQFKRVFYWLYLWSKHYSHIQWSQHTEHHQIDGFPDVIVASALQIRHPFIIEHHKDIEKACAALTTLNGHVKAAFNYRIDSETGYLCLFLFVSMEDEFNIFSALLQIINGFDPEGPEYSPSEFEQPIFLNQAPNLEGLWINKTEQDAFIQILGKTHQILEDIFRNNVSSTTQQSRIKMHLDWRPSEDCMALLSKQFSIEDIETALPSFIQYWIDRNEIRNTWNSTFVQYMQRFVLPTKVAKPPQPVNKEPFYESRKWRELRYKVLVAHGSRCMACGATPANGAVLHVDHIKPRSKYPELELEIDNLQVLCEDCNLGKSNKDETDWRE